MRRTVPGPREAAVRPNSAATAAPSAGTGTPAAPAGSPGTRGGPRTADVPPGAPLALFGALTAVHLLALAAGWDVAGHVTKPLLMPALIAYAVVRGGPRGLIAALACGWGGDVLLEVGGTVAFMAGMGCFAAGHVCYLRLFAARGALAGTGRASRPPSSVRRARYAGYTRYAGYAVVWAVMITLLWPGLDAGLRVPVAGYSLLLTAMAAVAGGLGARAALGGALFLLSDSLIATGLADWRQLPGHEVWIMLSYAAAQALLTLAVLGTPAPRPAPAPDRAPADR